MNDLPKLQYFYVERLIAEGGTAKVYWGVDRRTGYAVAIKELKQNLMNNPILRDKFWGMETQLMLYAKHPNIPELKDFIFDSQTKQMFIVMEYIKGVSLEHYIHDIIGPIPEDRALNMFMQILDTVQFLHNAYIPHLKIFKGVLHLDIKSNNIMLLPDDKIKILDLGIASRISDDTLADGIGTILYMPPEQFEKGKVGKYTDIFALGVTLFEMLTGQMPFTSKIIDPLKSKSEIRQKIKYAPTPNMKQFYPFISDELQPIVEKALAKDPADRYQSCEEFKQALTQFMKKKNKK